LQLEAATASVAALPQEMVLVVQSQMRRALREGMVELMREALASPEPGSPAAAAGGGGGGAASSFSTAAAADSGGDGGSCAAVDEGLAVANAEEGDGDDDEQCRSSSDSEAFVMVEATASDA
jgi:hypothetical protein